MAERGQDWSKVLTTDARFTESGQSHPAWPRTRGRAGSECTRRFGARQRGRCFLHDAGLLARYSAAGGHELLAGLQAAARRPTTTPHGLWLLCPGDSATGRRSSTGTSSRSSTSRSGWRSTRTS